MMAKTGNAATPEAQLEYFIDRFTPSIAGLARSALAKVRRRMRGAVEFVYDNTYALVIGFGPTERPSEAIFSIAIYPKKVSLCFLQGRHIPDPQKILQGNGNLVRHIRVESAKTLDHPDVKGVMTAAIDCAVAPMDPRRKRSMVIRAIAEKQRPRRPK